MVSLFNPPFIIIIDSLSNNMRWAISNIDKSACMTVRYISNQQGGQHMIFHYRHTLPIKENCQFFQMTDRHAV